jgi:HYDIN/CFA65/VesB-like, Ig-like domain
VGQANLSVSSITSTNGQFAVQTPSSGYPVIVGNGACFPFTVAFTPIAEGPQTTALSITSNDVETPVVAVGGSGTGTQRNIVATGSTAFGAASAWGPRQRTVKVCNIGQCPLTVTGATISCPDFALTANPLPVTLAPSACVDLTIAFTPTLPGPRTCQLNITSNDPDTPVIVRTLTGSTPPSLSLHAGWVDAHGAFGNVAGTGSTIELDFVNPIGTHFAWDLRLGRSHFDGTPGNPDTKVWRLAPNAKYTFNPTAPLRVFVNGGPDFYHFDPGSFHGGVNLGVGLNFPAGPRFSFEAKYDYNRAVTASPDLPFSQIQVGMLISF